jgi:hypothetical protein
MKGKKVVLTVFIAALVITVLLITRECYYVAISLMVGTILIGHRELWSLIRRKRRLPMDERVRENVNRSIRIGFMFLVIALAVLMLPYGEIITDNVGIRDVVSGLFLSAGVVYVLAYMYYDRVKPGLGDKGMKVYRGFLMAAGISLAVAVISAFLHNAVYALLIVIFGSDFWERTGITDEPVFFFLTLIAAAVFVLALIGSLGVYVKGLCSRAEKETISTYSDNEEQNQGIPE